MHTCKSLRKTAPVNFFFHFQLVDTKKFDSLLESSNDSKNDFSELTLREKKNERNVRFSVLSIYLREVISSFL